MVVVVVVVVVVVYTHSGLVDMMKVLLLPCTEEARSLGSGTGGGGGRGVEGAKEAFRGGSGGCGASREATKRFCWFFLSSTLSEWLWFSSTLTARLKVSSKPKSNARD